MLYDEFLRGTRTTENEYNYAEYRRIEKIYMDSDNMSKEEAYKLYNTPNDLLLTLMEENRKLRRQNSELTEKMRNMEKELEAANRKYEVEKNWNMTHLNQLRNELSNALYTMEDKLGVL